MNRLLVSTAIAGLLALATPALAQDRGDDHKDRGKGSQTAQPAPQQAPAQGARPQIGGRFGHGYTPPSDQRAQGNQPAPAPNNDRRAQDNRRPAAQPAPAPNNDRRAQGNDRGFDRGPGNDRRDFGNNRGQAFGNNGRGTRQDFSAFRRNFTAPRQFQGPVYRRPAGWYAHRWTFGEFLPSLFWAPQFWLDDYAYYGLMPPPPGTIWVRDGNDALLIDRYTGEIIQVDYNIFF